MPPGYQRAWDEFPASLAAEGYVLIGMAMKVYFKKKGPIGKSEEYLPVEYVMRVRAWLDEHPKVSRAVLFSPRSGEAKVQRWVSYYLRARALLDEGKTANEVAAELVISPMTLRYWGLVGRHSKDYPDIGSNPRSQMAKVLRAHGIEPRRARRRKPATFFEEAR